jgi:hypothetical protein
MSRHPRETSCERVQCHDGNTLAVVNDNAPRSRTGGTPSSAGQAPRTTASGAPFDRYWVAPLGLFRVASYMAFSRSCDVPS